MSNRAMAPASAFSYESKTWGSARLEARPWFMNGLKLRYLLDDLLPIQGKVLDIGCGAGSVAKAVKRARPDLEVVGCDLSSAALAVATALPEEVEFRKATAEKLPFADSEFDFVWIFDVLEHVDDPKQVLLEAWRVLRRGGGFHIVLPLENSGLYRAVGCGTRWTAKRRHGGHIQIFSAASYRNLAFHSGLPVANSRWTYHFLLQVLDILYFSWLDWHGPVSGSVEDMAVKWRGAMGVLLRLASSAVACLAWGEARFLRSVPGACGHFRSVKT